MSPCVLQEQNYGARAGVCRCGGCGVRAFGVRAWVRAKCRNFVQNYYETPSDWHSVRGVEGTQKCILPLFPILSVLNTEICT